MGESVYHHFLLILIVECVFRANAYTCPMNYKCLPSNKCRALSNDAIVYPCNPEGNLLCCPVDEPTEVKVVQRTPDFPEECGTPNDSDDRITYGDKASLGQFPWMALVGAKVLSYSAFFCGGSIINSRYVLTAAHCMKNKVDLVRLGEHNLVTDRDCTTGLEGDEICADPSKDVGVEKIIIHDSFSDVSYKNDIALIKLNETIKFTDYIRPICLPFGKDLTKWIFENDSYIVSGWGQSEKELGTEDLQFGKISGWNILKCNNLVSISQKPLDISQMCGIGIKSGKAVNSCHGDSGGPLIKHNIEGYKVKWYQYGIVSFGSAKTCENPEYPTIYVRVDYYLNWIINNVK